MQDTSLIPHWEPEDVLADLKKEPLDPKKLKAKLDKLYQISTYNELQYVGEVLEAYAWIKLAHSEPTFHEYFVNEKAERWFVEEFVATAIRYMIICRRFKNLVMMVLTQQMIVEGLRLYSHRFHLLDKFPKTNSIIRNALEYDKQFFKLNYANDYPLLPAAPTPAYLGEIDNFIATLKAGDPIDYLKNDPHSKRFCWVPATVKKLTSLSVHLFPYGERSSYTIDRKYMLVHPHESHKSEYEWRVNLKEGDFADWENSKNQWVKARVEQRKDDDEGENKIVVLLKWGDESEWVQLGDPRMQKPGILSESGSFSRGVSESFIDDFNDILLDPEMKSIAVLRPEYCRSTLFLALIEMAHKELHLFDRVLEAVEKRTFGVEVIADLVGCLSHLHPILHRNFALSYLPRLSSALTEYIVGADEPTIRNFSKQRYEFVSRALTEFLKRVKPSSERKAACEELQLGLILRFLRSDFLDRKLHAVSLLTEMIKHSKHRAQKRSTEEVLEWVKEKEILKLIFNEKAHSELISRSSDLLQHYLLSYQDIEELEPLLEWSQPILKLLNDVYEYLPVPFREKLVENIKKRKEVTSKDALDIVKRTDNCQEWLLANGGQGWVSVVKDKSKRKTDIQQVFNQPFPVVEKITVQVSELYEGRFKSEYFIMLHEVGYLPKVLADEDIDFGQRVKFAAVAVQPLAMIKDQIFQSLTPYTRRLDELPIQAQKFFVGLLPKLQSKSVLQLFEENFSKDESLKQLGVGQFQMFKGCFLRLNEEQRCIERKIISVYPTPHSYKKEKREILTIRANPNNLLGMEQVMKIVFGTGDLSVTQRALEFIGFLFDHLAPELASSAAEFRGVFLQSCLEKLYAETDHQEKYLRIIEGLLDESEKGGIDAEPSVAGLFLNQDLTLRVVDHFNVNKCRMSIEAPASLTLHELKAIISRHINAFPKEVKLLHNNKELNPRLSGRVIHTLGLTEGEVVVEKISTVEKVSLCETDGSLNDKCKSVLGRMFKEYSQLGLMSKAQCIKYHQRCVGEVSSLSESKVDKIYDQYDTDKDGYLTEENFLAFYEHSAKVRQSAVWSNLETFGIRNDLEDLRELPISYPPAEQLSRHLLAQDLPFMSLLIKLLQSDNEQLVETAWRVASRLPLLPQETFFSLKIDTSKPLLFRYWLYEVVASEKWNLLTIDILERLLTGDIETTCIGLRAAVHSPNFEVNTFHQIVTNLKNVPTQGTLSFHWQVVLDNSLRIVEWLLRENEGIRQDFSARWQDYVDVLSSGIMAKNTTVRRMFCEAMETVSVESAEAHFEVFQPVFRLIYGTFEKCDKTTLSPQYFELYSKLLEILKQHHSLLPRLELNWLILTRTLIAQFLTHKSTETGVNSPPDPVAQGFLRILRKLLEDDTLKEMVPLVKFLFQQSLFPESGQNKLKNSKSRHQAYELLCQICALRDEKGESPGLKELFEAGFKSVYKKMSTQKSSSSYYSYSSYFYSYNEARSELGYAGIRNLGCICYMISMIQQLFMTQCFRSLVLMAEDGEPECLVKKGTKEVDDNLFHQLQNLFANLELTEKGDYTPDEFCFSFKDFEGQPVNVSIQQDAQEFLNLFFDKIENALKPTPFRSILEDVFGGKTCQQTVCSNCKCVNQRLENFYPLSLQIKGFKSIWDSFRRYTAGEVISDYKCDACGKKTDVTKSSILAEVPNYFILHLQRMCFNYDRFENEKVNSRWEFPYELNVYDYSLDKQQGKDNQHEYDFQLRGVVLHYGSADFGHYFSYIKEENGRWIEFNDERVREFDPHDMEADCFGGEHWRRESQNAYLLVYEKVHKKPLRLHFDKPEEQQDVISRFGLTDSVLPEEQAPEVEATSKEEIEERDDKELMHDDKQVETEGAITESDKQTEKGQQTEGEKKEEEKKNTVVVKVSPEKIPKFVPQKLNDKINKANEEFSFTMNLSNDEFAHFLHKCLSIDPPASLTTEFLELCYECFHLRTVVDQEQGLTLSEWAAGRFKQIIGGHGWEFLKAFGQNWQSDILSIQRSTRVAMKNLLQCVITDIIKAAEQEEDPTDKNKLVRQFLHQFTDMLDGEVGKHWTRFREYFEVWISLINESEAVREWCKEVKMVEKLLDFVLEEFSPFAKGNKKYSLRSMNYGAEFEFPLEVATVLLKEGYVLSEEEKKCMRNYAFIEKVIKFPTEHYNLVDFICKDDRPLSQKFAYLLLTEMGKVSQSDEIKPMVTSVFKFLQIKDGYENDRVSWLLGFPQYSEGIRTNSYGVFGINPDQDQILNFVSAVRAAPLTQHLIKYRGRAQHVAALILTMLLQLESDGFIENLDSLPSPYAFHQSYTFWFQDFVDGYYEETHRSFIAKHYTEYGNRLRALWEGRPSRHYEARPQYLIGRSLAKNKVNESQPSQILATEYFDITSRLVLMTEDNAFLNKRNIKNYADSDDFKVKTAVAYGSSFLNVDRAGFHSSDDDDSNEQTKENPFAKAFEGTLFRKITVRNLTYESVLVLAKIKTAAQDPNFEPANIEMSFEIRGESSHVITLKKHRVDEPFGEFELELVPLGRATREGYWPRQILTALGEEKEEDKDSSDEQEETSGGTWAL